MCCWPQVGKAVTLRFLGPLSKQHLSNYAWQLTPVSSMSMIFDSFIPLSVTLTLFQGQRYAAKYQIESLWCLSMFGSWHVDKDQMLFMTDKIMCLRETFYVFQQHRRLLQQIVMPLHCHWLFVGSCVVRGLPLFDKCHGAVHFYASFRDLEILLVV